MTSRPGLTTYAGRDRGRRAMDSLLRRLNLKMKNRPSRPYTRFVIQIFRCRQILFLFQAVFQTFLRRQQRCPRVLMASSAFNPSTRTRVQTSGVRASVVRSKAGCGYAARGAPNCRSRADNAARISRRLGSVIPWPPWPARSRRSCLAHSSSVTPAKSRWQRWCDRYTRRNRKGLRIVIGGIRAALNSGPSRGRRRGVNCSRRSLALNGGRSRRRVWRPSRSRGGMKSEIGPRLRGGVGSGPLLGGSGGAGVSRPVPPSVHSLKREISRGFSAQY